MYDVHTSCVLGVHYGHFVTYVYTVHARAGETVAHTLRTELRSVLVCGTDLSDSRSLLFASFAGSDEEEGALRALFKHVCREGSLYSARMVIHSVKPSENRWPINHCTIKK